MGMLEGVFSVMSERETAGWALERSSELTALGKLDEARRCLWKVIDSSVDPSWHRWASANLAWLEEDPEIAARYFELSLQGDERGRWLGNAVRLCQATGSDALAEHYLGRLCIQNPEMARYYEEK